MIVAALAGAAALATILALAAHARYGLYLVGVTGSVACGKSTFCDGLRRAGQTVIDLDEVTHRLQLPGTPTWFAILKKFSPNPGRPDLTSPLLDPVTKAINRLYLSQLVFSDRAKLTALNRIMRFPILKSMMAAIWHAFFVGRCRIIFLEAPLLFETGRRLFALRPIYVFECVSSGLNHVCDVSIVVEAPLPERLNRIKRRLSGNEDEARARIRAQMPQEEKVSRAHVVISNSGTKQDLHDRALHLALPLGSMYNRATMLLWLASFLSFTIVFSLVSVIIR